LRLAQSIKVTGCIVIEETFIIPDGEFDVSTERGVVEDMELPQQVVEYRPQVIATIADN